MVSAKVVWHLFIEFRQEKTTDQIGKEERSKGRIVTRSPSVDLVASPSLVGIRRIGRWQEMTTLKGAHLLLRP